MKKNKKSETSTKAVGKAKCRFESLQFMQWLDKFIKPRKAKINLEAGTGNSDPEIDTNFEDNNNNTPHLSDLPDLQESFVDEDLSVLSDDEEQTKVKREIKRPRSTKKTPEISAKKQRKSKISKSSLDVQTEKMNVLRSVATAATKTKDEYDIFGEYVGWKLRKLSEILTEKDMEMVEFNITNTLMQARSQNLLPTTNSAALNFTSNMMQGGNQNILHGSYLMGDNKFSYLKMLNP